MTLERIYCTVVLGDCLCINERSQFRSADHRHSAHFSGSRIYHSRQLNVRPRKDRHVVLVLSLHDVVGRSHEADIPHSHARLLENFPGCAIFKRLSKFEMASGKAQAVCSFLSFSF